MGPLSHIVKVRLAAVRSSQKIVFFIAKFNKADMEVLRDLLEAGKVTPVIDRQYELGEIADALRYLGEGHAQGKIVVTVWGVPEGRGVVRDAFTVGRLPAQNGSVGALKMIASRRSLKSS